MIEKAPAAARPVLIVPYVWIGDFVRCHSVVRLLRLEDPARPVDIVSSTLCAPLADYMPGVRRAIVADLPRRRLGLTLQFKLAGALRAGGYGQALVMSRKWKAALAPWLAGIPRRTGFFGEVRIGLVNDLRCGRAQAAAHDRPDGRPRPAQGRAAAGRLAFAGAEGARRPSWRPGGPGAGLAAEQPADRHPLPRRGRRRQGLAAGALCGVGQGAGAGRRHGLGRSAARARPRRPGRSRRPPAGACAT